MLVRDSRVLEKTVATIVRKHQPEQRVADGNLLLRISHLHWVLSDDEAPLPVVAADLLDHPDARVSRTAIDQLR